MAERVLARFEGKAVTTGKRARARPAKTAPVAGEKRSARGNQQTPGVSLSDATLKAVQAHDEGATARDVLDYLSREFGMTIRRTTWVWRCNATAVPGGSTTAISAGTSGSRHRIEGDSPSTRECVRPEDAREALPQRRPRILTAAPGRERAASKLLCLHGAESSNSPARAPSRGCVARLAPSGGNIPALALKNVPAVRVKASALVTSPASRCR
jgi:hypothetical protein